MIQSIINKNSVLVQTVNVGVTGHRNIPAESINRLQKNIDLVLSCIKNAVRQVRHEAIYKGFFDRFDNGQEAKFRIISQLAEGIDRQVAHSGLKQGYVLQSLLPFRQDLYEKTFDDNAEAMQDFHDLLEKSDNIFEIACSNDNSSQAYADASRVMLSHSDILLSVWNGKKTKYIAGTYATMQEAKRLNLPIICIPSQGDSSVDVIPVDCVAFITDVDVEFFRLIGEDSEQELARFTQSLRIFIEKIILPHRIIEGVPGYSACDVDSRLRKTAGIYTSTCYLNMPLVSCYENFEKLMCLGAVATIPNTVDKTAVCEEEKARIEQFTQNASGYWTKLKKHFSKMAVPYAVIYRKRLFFRNLLPIFALLALVFAINADWWLGFSSENALNNVFKWIMYVLQVLLWGWMFFLIYQESRRGVKIRFYAYRVLAEHCRLSPFLWAVGYCNVRYRHSYSLTHKGHGESAWYYRLLARNAGFASENGGGKRVVLDAESVIAWLLWLKNDFLVSQYKYHAKRMNRLFLLSSRLSLIAVTLYIIGMLFVVVRGIFHLLRDCDAAHYADVNVIIIAIAFTLPTVASFFSSYSGNSGFSFHHSVSHDMNKIFNALCKEADNLCEEMRTDLQKQKAAHVVSQEYCMKRQIMEGRVAYTHILAFCEKMSAHCLNELADWVNAPSGNLNKFL